MVASADLQSQIESALSLRNPRREGGEIVYTCTNSQEHRNGDAHPSAHYNAAKGTFYCHVCEQGGGLVDLAKALGINGNSPSDSGKQTYYFDYRDEDGKLLYQVVRTEPGKNGNSKDLKQRRPNGRGDWIWQTAGIRRVPYCLPELLAAEKAEAIHYPEGEKKVRALQRWGLVATCNSGGAGKWNNITGLADMLAGRNVVILADNDDKGRQHAYGLANYLYNLVQSVKVVEFPDLRPAGDIIDWITAGHTKEDYLELVDKTPTWTPSWQRSVTSEVSPSSCAVPTTISALNLSIKKFEPPKWVINPILTEGLAILSGKPKLGKSWLMLSIALAVGAGGIALGKFEVEAGDVLYLALEDSERRLQERMDMLMADECPPSRLHFATEWPRLDDGGLQALNAWLETHPDARLVIVDTLKRIRAREQYGQTLYSQDYEAVQPLADLAKRRGICIVTVTHNRKMGADDALDLVSGSAGLTGSADTVMVLKRDRGAADAVLSITGRDVTEQELALSWQPPFWTALGDAGQYRLSQERRAILELCKDQALTPKEVADLTNKDRSGVKMLLWRMSKDGLLKAESGKYRTLLPALL